MSNDSTNKTNTIKIMKIFAKLIAVLILFALVLGIWFVRRPWPKTDGRLTIAPLSERVEVIRDEYGIPHIYAGNDRDLMIAQGYVHAQDRFWQMEVNRRIGNGTLGEMVGEGGIGFDRFIRTVGLRRMAEKSWVAFDDDTRGLLEAYADGVNAYLEANPLPLEMTFLGIGEAEPWTPIDTLVWGNVMALNLSDNHYLELVRIKIAAEYGVDLAYRLFPTDQPNFPRYSDLPANFSQIPLDQFDMMTQWQSHPQTLRGSNAWVIHGSRTETGKPMLMGDMHLELGMPSTWYEIGLHGGRFDVVGLSLPGVPLIITGHNQDIAWSVTNMSADSQDVFLEKVDDLKNPTQYQYQGEWRDIEVIEEILMNGDTAEPFLIYQTEHGLLITDLVDPNFASEYAYALAWSVYDEGNPLFEALKRVNLSQNWGEFRDALSYWHAPALHFVYADVEGHIGYQAAGKIPLRRTYDGAFPVNGWEGEHKWEGFIPFDELPSVFNPERGYFVTANDKPVSDDYPYLLGTSWRPGYRAERINSILASNNSVTASDMIMLQMDTYSIVAETLMPYLSRIEPQSDLETDVLDQLSQWDFYYETNAISPLIFDTWYKTMVAQITKDELKQIGLDELFASIDLESIKLIRSILQTPNDPLFDRIDTVEVETGDDILQQSFSETVAKLQGKWGDDVNAWQWGEAHKITFVDPILGRSGIKLVENLFNSDAHPAPGTSFTVNAAWSTSPEVSMTSGASERLILDLNDFDASLSINPPGQSGHVFHKNRKDQIEMWLAGDYHPALFSRSAVMAHAKDTLQLVPEK